MHEASILVVAKDQVSCDLAGEAAILHLKNGVYYGLNPMGARIWKWIQEPQRFDEIRRRILEEFDVEPERCDRELRELLEKLASEGLIEVRD